MRSFLTVPMLLLSYAVNAAVANITWTLPTEFTDNTALMPADVASTTVEYGTCVGSNVFGTKTGQVVATGAATSTVVTSLSAGTWCFRAFTTVVAAKGGLSSTTSNVASKMVPFPAPKPPTLLDVIIAFIRRLFSYFA